MKSSEDAPASATGRIEKLKNQIAEKIACCDVMMELLPNQRKEIAKIKEHMIALEKELKELKDDTKAATEVIIKMATNFFARDKEFNQIIFDSLESIHIPYTEELNKKIEQLNSANIFLAGLENNVDQPDRDEYHINSLRTEINSLYEQIRELNKKIEIALGTIQVSLLISDPVYILVVNIQKEWESEIHPLIKKEGEEYNSKREELLSSRKESKEQETRVWDAELAEEKSAAIKAQEEAKIALDERDESEKMIASILKNENKGHVLTFSSQMEYQENKRDINTRLLQAYANAALEYCVKNVDIDNLNTKFIKPFKDRFQVDLLIIENDQVEINIITLEQVAKNFSPGEIIQFINQQLTNLNSEKGFISNLSKFGGFSALNGLFNDESQASTLLNKEISALADDARLKDVIQIETDQNSVAKLKIIKPASLAPLPLPPVKDANDYIKKINTAHARGKKAFSSLKDKIITLQKAVHTLLIETNKLITFFAEQEKKWKTKELKPNSIDNSADVDKLFAQKIEKMSSEDIVAHTAKLIKDVHDELINDSRMGKKHINSYLSQTYASFFSPHDNSSYIGKLTELNEQISQKSCNYQKIIQDIDAVIHTSQNNHIQQVFLSLKLNLQNFEENLQKLRPNKSIDQALHDLSSKSLGKAVK